MMDQPPPDRRRRPAGFLCLCLGLLAPAGLAGCFGGAPIITVGDWDAGWRLPAGERIEALIEERALDINRRLAEWEYFGKARKAPAGEYEHDDGRGVTRCKYFRYVEGQLSLSYAMAPRATPVEFRAEQPATREYELPYDFVAWIEVVPEIRLVLLVESEYERDGDSSTRTKRERLDDVVQVPAISVEYGRARFRFVRQDTVQRAGNEIAVYDEDHVRVLGWSEQRNFSGPDELVAALELALEEVTWERIESQLRARFEQDDKRRFDDWARLFAEQYAAE